jgi:Uma2 family endonuclease
VVEVVSNSSMGKDRKRLPALYAQAGVPELWLVDARADTPAFEVWSLKAGGYEQVVADGPPPDRWTSSPVLGCRFRLQRRMVREGHFVYNLESSS